MTFIVAIDGPSASGKGTIAVAVANLLQFDYLNTGALYRAVASIVLQHAIDISNISKIVDAIVSIEFNMIDESNLYSREISNLSSVVAAIPEVRQALLEVQRNFPLGKDGVVVEGRDIGTVIFPNANVKIYITASIEERTKRRFKQLQTRGENVIHDEVLRDLQTRDARDSSRPNAPLTQGHDYSVIDTTSSDIHSAINDVLKLISIARSS